MLVEINLLPKKEQKNYTLWAALLAVLLLFLAAGIFLFWQGTNYQTQLRVLDNQISTTKKITEIQQSKIGNNQASNSIAVLETAVEWAKDEPVKTVPVIKHVTALLPNRGFVQTITYSGSGMVKLSIQFDTTREAAFYLKNLLDSEWVSEAKLSSVSIMVEETEDTTDTKETKITTSKTNPRYLGEYEIMLDRKFINALEKEERTNASKQGGKAS